MQFPTALLKGTLVKRYNRFLADIRLHNSRVITAHCPNSGSMITCAEPGWKVLISRSANPARRLKYTWELVHNGKCWIGINTLRTNNIAKEAIQTGKIRELADYPLLKTEVPYGNHSRIDLLLKKPYQKCYVEVKSVTLVQDGFYKFPDAVTKRGAKHLDELLKVKRQGHRAVMLFIIQRSDGTMFTPAADIDPVYANKLKRAYKAGVEVLVYGTKITVKSIEVNKKAGFCLNDV